MADLVIGNYLLLLVSKDRILLLVSCDDYLDALLEVGLACSLAPVADSSESCLIYYIGKLSTGCAGCHSCDSAVVDVVLDLDLLGMYF